MRSHTVQLGMLLLDHHDLLGGVVALSVGHRTCDLWVAGSSPASAPLRSGLRQATYTCVPLSPSSITWYRSKGGDSLKLGR